MQEAEIPTESLQLRGSRLWALAYTALWLNLSLLASLIYWPRLSPMNFIWIVAWALAIGLLAWFVQSIRILLHDLLVSLAPRDKFLLALGCLIPLLGPLFSKTLHVATDGLF